MHALVEHYDKMECEEDDNNWIPLVVISDARLRAGDIVKSRGQSSSPERSLLSNPATPMHQDNLDDLTETIDLSSPSGAALYRNSGFQEPPRNIFDDI